MAPAAPRGKVYRPNPKRSSANALGSGFREGDKKCMKTSTGRLYLPEIVVRMEHSFMRCVLQASIANPLAPRGGLDVSRWHSFLHRKQLRKPGFAHVGAAIRKGQYSMIHMWKSYSKPAAILRRIVRNL
jgi:hypothetical protein